jgi:hypothetical protein
MSSPTSGYASPLSSRLAAILPAANLSTAIFLLAVIARLIPGARTIDDSYITYRYARDILSGQGFVFNPGEHVQGTTTPLYTALMVLGGALSGGTGAPFPQIAMLINALADGIVCLLFIRLGRQLDFRFAGIGAALAWAIAPYSVTFAIGGLETSLFVLLLVGTACAHLEDRHNLAMLLAALAFLTRPDALIFIGLLGLDRLWQVVQEQRKKQLSIPRLLVELLIFLIPTASWIIFAWLYFGSPIPHSIAAKTLAYRLSPESGFVRLLQHYATPFMEDLTFGVPFIGVGLVLYPFLYIIGGRRAIRANPHIWPWLVFPWLYFAIFSIANPLIFRWYMTTPLPAYYFFILGGAEGLILSIAAARSKKTAGLDAAPTPPLSLSTRLVIIFLVILAPMLLLLRDWQLHPDHGLDRPAPSMAWYKLELLYRQAADILAPDLQKPGQSAPTLAAGDVGVLGFYTGVRILDTVGLNSPQSTRYYPLDPTYYVINYAIPPQLILDTKPDFVVILEVYGRLGLLKSPLFWQLYTLRQKIPTDIYGSDGLLIFERTAP